MLKIKEEDLQYINQKDKTSDIYKIKLRKTAYDKLTKIVTILLRVQGLKKKDRYTQSVRIQKRMISHNGSEEQLKEELLCI